MYTYSITGQANCNDADTESGTLTANIDATIQVNELGAEAALRKFFSANEQYDDFFSLISCDQETYGNIGASFVDRTNNDRHIDVDLIDDLGCDGSRIRQLPLRGGLMGEKNG